MYLTNEQFTAVVASTPLVSIDFVARNAAGQVLLGKRTNKPAQGFWFVPGGRILKDERMEDAFERLSEAEFGVAVSMEQGRFLGVYEHLYGDSSFDDSISTHYLVLGYQITLDTKLEKLPVTQHAEFQWFDVDELMSSETVHSNTKAYFAHTPAGKG